MHYVDVNSTNKMPPFTNWTTAAASIQDTVDAAVAKDEILVTNRFYTGRQRVVPRPDRFPQRFVTALAATARFRARQPRRYLDQCCQPQLLPGARDKFDFPDQRPIDVSEKFKLDHCLDCFERNNGFDPVTMPLTVHLEFDLVPYFPV